MSFINGYIEMTEGAASPSLFRKWAAIWAVGATLERKVWVTTTSPIYPNLYVVLCAPPGVGKTEAIWPVRELLDSIEDIYLAPSSLTKASLIDDLNEAERRIMRASEVPPMVSYNSMKLVINELGVLIPAYENDFMNVLTDLYDGKGYGERRRSSRIEINIKHPQINLIAGTTPGYLSTMLPEGAWDQGFMSRTFVVFSAQRELRELFPILADRGPEMDKLKAILADIFDLYGEMKITQEAKDCINNWYIKGGEPQPQHPKLISYNSRRGVHLIKLSMIAAIDTHMTLVIDKADVLRALDWLIEAEHYMPDVFKAISAGGAGQYMEELWHYLFVAHSKSGKPVPEHKLLQFLSERIPVHQIDQTIEMMKKAKRIEKVFTAGGNAYKPRGRPSGQPDY